MAKKFKILIVFMSLSLSLCFMSNTYSRYVANTTGNLEVVFAKWQILLNETDITNSSESTITLVPVVEENKYVASDTIAPSSKGYFDIDIDPSNVDVSFNYSINLEYENENIPDLMITKYAIIDDNYKDGDEVNAVSLTNNKIENTLNFDNTVENFEFKPFTVRVYFEWYEGTDEQMDDEQDSEIGTSAVTDDTSFQINAKIAFEQKIN